MLIPLPLPQREPEELTVEEVTQLINHEVTSQGVTSMPEQGHQDQETTQQAGEATQAQRDTTPF